MDGEAVLMLIFRWLHILAAITTVGGSVFARAVVVPTLAQLPAEEARSLHAAMRARWSLIVAGAIGFLLISGLFNVGTTMIQYTLPRWYHILFGFKFLLALGVFTIASFLAGKTPVADRMRQNVRFWLNLNIALAVTVVCLSGVLRTAVKVPKPQQVSLAGGPLRHAAGENCLAEEPSLINVEF